MADNGAPAGNPKDAPAPIRWPTRSRDEMEKERQGIFAANIAAEARKRAGEAELFQRNILKAWRAKGDAEPFLTIRGDYDLSNATGGRWKTTLDTNDCDLTKKPGTAAA